MDHNSRDDHDEEGVEVAQGCRQFVFVFNPVGDENRYAMTFGGDYGFKDGAESMILSVHCVSFNRKFCGNGSISMMYRGTTH
jgi:hypothetical protein